jgi:hypothetical protein
MIRSRNQFAVNLYGDAAAVLPKPAEQVRDREGFVKCADFAVYRDFKHDEKWLESSAWGLVAEYTWSL